MAPCPGTSTPSLRPLLLQVRPWPAWRPLNGPMSRHLNPLAAPAAAAGAPLARLDMPSTPLHRLTSRRANPPLGLLRPLQVRCTCYG